MSYHREKIVNVSLILLNAQNPWKALEVEDIGLKFFCISKLTLHKSTEMRRLM